MAEMQIERCRLSIDVGPEDRRRIKMSATIHNETIREYVLKAVMERLQQDSKHTESLLSMNGDADPVLADLWNNEKDSAYDKL